MTENRYKRLVSSIDYYYCIDATNDKGLTEEDMLNRLNEQYKTIEELWRENKSYMGDAIKFEKECKRLYNNLRLTNSDLCSEKIMHNHCKKENEQLKETIKELELENAKHIGDGEWDIRDITYGHGKFRLEEWGERYHQFYNGDKQLEDEEVVSLLFENEQLKKYNKGQELEIIRLHNLADAMSAVLRELGIYDVYNDEQIENVKRRIINV